MLKQHCQPGKVRNNFQGNISPWAMLRVLWLLSPIVTPGTPSNKTHESKNGCDRALQTFLGSKTSTARVGHQASWQTWQMCYKNWCPKREVIKLPLQPLILTCALNCDPCRPATEWKKTSKCWNFQEEGWIRENLLFSATVCVLGSLCHLSSVPLSAPHSSHWSSQKAKKFVT